MFILKLYINVKINTEVYNETKCFNAFLFRIRYLNSKKQTHFKIILVCDYPSVTAILIINYGTRKVQTDWNNKDC